jgi:hypothetical protein
MIPLNLGYLKEMYRNRKHNCSYQGLRERVMVNSLMDAEFQFCKIKVSGLGW